ncbi:CvpA family protein [Putridiphycobacter roseus]|uniref:CvpA family protein n=2 Tax=Putridiphycobacter roseus TaxID=2219161 RepID=A0A2W1NEZ1_9FLAO|nr:CvpA family protein [Putridiphycobacter roseus]
MWVINLFTKVSAFNLNYLYTTMNYLDFILLVPVLIGAWKGFKKGFIIEVFTLLALFAGLYGAVHFTDFMAEILKDKLSLNSEYLPIVSFVVTFLLVGAMVYFLGKMLEKAISMVALSTINKFAGLVFGGLKMLLLSSVIVIVLEAIDEKNKFLSKEIKETSLLYEPLKKMNFTVIPAIEESTLFQNRFNLLDLLKSDK